MSEAPLSTREKALARAIAAAIVKDIRAEETGHRGVTCAAQACPAERPARHEPARQGAA